MATDLTTGLNEGVVRSGEVANVDGAAIAGGTEVLAWVKPASQPGADASRDDTRREEGLLSSSSYTLASDQSLYSSQVDSWLRGGVATTENIGVQQSRSVVFLSTANILSLVRWWKAKQVNYRGHSGRRPHPFNILGRLPFAQRPALTTAPSLDPSGLWYLIALILPLFSANRGLQFNWCTPENVMNAGVVLVAQVSRFCHEIRGTVRRLAQEQIDRDLFATIMDIVLIIYAIGFLFLSLYQACFFG